jgi:hypothetical protein
MDSGQGGEVSKRRSDVHVLGRSGLSILEWRRGRASCESISFALASGDADVWPVATGGQATYRLRNVLYLSTRSWRHCC